MSQTTTMQQASNNDETIELVFEQYKTEHQLAIIKKLMDEDLSEPYSVYTYRYFVNNWPEATFIAYLKQDEERKSPVGAIVCKYDEHAHTKNLRGYIAMLAVEKQHRKKGLGSVIVSKAITTLEKAGCTEIVLETEVSNKAALRLYENLGFLREKRLHKYYLNGSDAFRLKLWLN